MTINVTSDPVAEPVALAEMKDYLRVDSSDEDALITGMIISAREYCETYTKRTFVTQTSRYTLQEWPDGDTIEMPQPINDTTGLTVTYYASGSTSGTLLGSTTYWVDADSKPGRVVRKNNLSWPTTTLRSAKAIEVSFESGYGGQGDVPEGVRLAIKFLVGHWYANREAVVVGTISKSIEFGVHALLGPFVVPYIA